jgi:hypothetical protein
MSLGILLGGALAITAYITIDGIRTARRVNRQLAEAEELLERIRAGRASEWQSTSTRSGPETPARY